jgi:myo-inositol-1-phosphate synthase
MCGIDNKRVTVVMLSTPKTGMMIAGLQGNNGSTLAAFLAIDANDFPGSIIRHGTVKSVKQPVRDFVNIPQNIPIGGWDVRKRQPWVSILKQNEVLNSEQINEAAPLLEKTVSILPGIFLPGFINLPEDDGVDRVIEKLPVNHDGLSRLINDIDSFANDNKLEHIVVIYSGCTEKNVDWTFEDCLSWPPSVYYAMAAVQTKVRCSFINACAQISTSKKMMEAFDEKNRICIGNFDLKTGQTKLKGLILDYLFSCGFPPIYVASSNYLSNRDGYNLKPGTGGQNESKILTKSSMLDECRSERSGCDQKSSIAHSVTIDYLEGSGDNKLAIDEYSFGLAFGGKTAMSIRTVCPDTLLAIPLLYDITIWLSFMSGRMLSARASSLLSYYFKSTKYCESQFLLEQLEELTEWCVTNKAH